jgi:LemA protein
MGPFLIAVLLILGLIAVVLVFAGVLMVSVYNRLVALRNDYKNQYAQIDVQLKRRHDLIPNLVETAKGYMAHERGTLDEVTSARNGAVAAHNLAANAGADPTALPKIAAAEGALSQSLGRLFAVAEAYPDLKANQTMMQLQHDLADTEDRISQTRQIYNDSVRVYNTQREIFPNSLLAGLFNFAPASLYEIENPGEREAPKISFA